LAVVFSVACSNEPVGRPAGAVVRKSTPDVILAPTVLGESVPVVSPSPRFESAEIVVAVPTALPTVDVGSIPNSDRPRAAAPLSVRDQMVRCVTFSLGRQEMGPITERHIVRVEVRAKSVCPDQRFGADESWFEVRALDRAGRVVARQQGRFQTPIEPFGEAVTFVELAITIDDRLEVSVP
jgi:hypothetical protein